MAQAAHASMKVFFDRGVVYSSLGKLAIELTEPMIKWVNGIFAKIVVGCNSEEELINLAQAAADANIPHALITDVGRTEFHGEPTVTALAIGPDYPEKIDPITGGLKLL